MDLHEALHHYFHYREFRPGQEEVLRQVLAGRDALVVMPTGSGKSLIYQLAALLLPHTSLVISPLVALMKDQVDGLTRRGIPATFINSSLDAAEQSARLGGVVSGQYKIVLVSPERLRLQNFRAAMSRVPLSQFVVDEAHCLSQWGHDFRPDYLYIAEARRELKAPVTLALTATATQRVQDDILRLLAMPEAARLITGFNRPNLALEAFSTPDPSAKQRLLRDFLPEAGGAGIIYAGTRKNTEEVAAYLRDTLKFEVDHYHAGLDAATRERVQNAFMSGDLPIVVATNAFGMGIDRPDVRFVLHYNMPGSLEAYYQEAGRAGRDGLPARALLCYSPKDTALQEFFIDVDVVDAPDLAKLHDYLNAQSRAGTPLQTPWEGVERALTMPQTKARVALEQLELAGAIRRRPSSNHRLIEAELLPLQPARLKTVVAEAAKRREHKRHLLSLMVRYAETDACRRRTLLDYFGDHSLDGGEPSTGAWRASSPPQRGVDGGEPSTPVCCDNCLARAERESAGPEVTRPAESQSERAALIVLDTIAHLKWGVGQGTLARVLRGGSGEKTKDYVDARNFGKFSSLRLKEIEALISQMTEGGYIKQVGSLRPTLRLTPRGEDALRARSAIAVELRQVHHRVEGLTPATARDERRGAVHQSERRRRQAELDAGSTVALSGQLLGQGMTPEQIAEERGLTPSTIYSHLAQLIAAGKLDLSAVVGAPVQKLVLAAISQSGSTGYLAPIKALLPEEIDYGVIRCVVEAWKRGYSL